MLVLNILVHVLRLWILIPGLLTQVFLSTCHDSNLFLCVTPLRVPLIINLPNYFKISVTHIGRVSLQPKLILDNVLHVSDFKYNLLSIHKLCCQFYCTTFFNSGGCVLQAPFMKRAQAFGEFREGIYLLQWTTSYPKGYISDSI